MQATTQMDYSDFTTPLGSAGHGRLEFARGAARVTIRGDEISDLFRGRFIGAAPMVLGDDGRVTVEYPRLSPSEWLRPDRRAADVVLNSAIPWELVFSGGVFRLHADLTPLTLRSLEIRRGASDLDVFLPRPQGVVRIRVGGGASKVAFRRPVGVAVRLSIAGGASKLTLDDQHFGSLGHRTRLNAGPGADDRDRYEIEIGGGASELTVGVIA
jgi:hypothetical protein